MRNEKWNEVGKSVKSQITEIIIKAHSDKITIPEAVENIMEHMKIDLVQEENNDTKSIIVDPLFEKGPLPVDELKHCVIQEIQQTRSGNYRYFIHDKYNSYGSGWLSEDDLIKKITNIKKENSKN